MSKQCEYKHRCNKTQCGTSFIDTLLITRLGFTEKEAGIIKYNAEVAGIEPVEYIRIKSLQ